MPLDCLNCRQLVTLFGSNSIPQTLETSSTSHLIAHPMHVLYSPPQCEYPLQPSVRCTTPLPEALAPLCSHSRSGWGRRGCWPLHLQLSLHEGATIQRPADALLQFSSMPGLHHKELKAKGLVIPLQEWLGISEYQSMHWLCCHSREGSWACAHMVPAAGYRPFTPGLIQLVYAPAWREGSEPSFSALNTNKYHLYLWVIKTEEVASS